MMQVVNTGISALIESTGQVRHRAQLFKPLTEISDESWRGEQATYFCNVFTQGRLLLALLGLILDLVLRRHERQAHERPAQVVTPKWCFISVSLSSIMLPILALSASPTLAEHARHGEITSTNSQGHFEYTNRLISSRDPYLLLHAHNPVDWYPWGSEALAKARRENKPVFISIGYSTCYWCHVAERTVYSNPQIAKLMNQWFVNIKVDREQLPDVDRVYMLATELMTGEGGWPNNVFLTPDLKPFFAGSYFPPDDFTNVIEKIHHIWTTDPGRIVAKEDKPAFPISQWTTNLVKCCKALDRCGF